MSTIVRAIVVTNSSDDEFGRVKIEAEGLWENSVLVESVGGIPLKAGDYVFVDVSQGFENPLIIGRSMGTPNKFHMPLNGSLLFESSNGATWTVAFVKNDSFEIVNSAGFNLKITGSQINVMLAPGGLLSMQGTCVPNGTGVFCGIPVCPFTGAPHVGSVVSV